MTMATTGSSGTFAQWLAKQLARPDTDMVGWLARTWKRLENPDRPKVSSPTGIARVLTAMHDNPEWQPAVAEAITAATEAYRADKQAASLATGGPAAQVYSGKIGGPVEPFPSDMPAIRQLDAPGAVMKLRTDDLAEHADDTARDTAALFQLLGQLQAQLGIVMQMLAVSNPLAAQVLLDHVSADASAAEGPGADQLTDMVTAGQNRAQQIAQANGWIVPDEPPGGVAHTGMSGGFDAWWATAEPGDGDG